MILLTDTITMTEQEFSTVEEATKYAAYLMSLGHEVKMERGGN